MSSSNKLVPDWIDERGIAHFSVIVAFSYYDGPEDGIAISASGKGIRFKSLGDSRSRLFRSFELLAIQGTWQPDIDLLRGNQSGRILVPDASEQLASLERRVLTAPETHYYVGVGSIDFERLSVSEVRREQLEELRQFGGSPDGFLNARKLIKGCDPQ